MPGATIPGEIGDVTRFSELEKLGAYARIDLTVHESSQFRATETHMSKRGSPHLPRALWLVANIAGQYGPDPKAYCHQKQEGQHRNTFIGALRRKLLACVYIVLQKKRPYVVR